MLTARRTHRRTARPAPESYVSRGRAYHDLLIAAALRLRRAAG